MRTISASRTVFTRLGGLALLVCTLYACAPPALPPATPTQTTAPSFTPIPATQTPAPTSRHILVTATPSPTPAIMPATLTPAPTQPGSGLIIEEHELLYKPSFEPLAFRPVSGSQDAVLAKYAASKQGHFERRSALKEGAHISYPVVGDNQLLVRMFESGEEPAVRGKGRDITVEVLQNGEVIFQTPAGQASPIDTVRGLWVDGSHWYLEITSVTNAVYGNMVRSDAVGQLFQDGTLLNEKYDHTQTFGFQLLGGKPFYFYEQDGRVYASYDGQDLPLAHYDEIPHYLCCSAAELNPRSGPNWIGFFGRRGKTWYYTEILAQ